MKIESRCLMRLMIPFFAFFLFTGCSLFQASPEEVEQYREEFIEMVDLAAIEAESGKKVLAEVRQKVEDEGLKKTKAQNTILNGVSISKSIKEDVIKARIPQEMEPLRENLILAMDKRIEAYDHLFKYYDFLDDQYRISGDQLLSESYQMFDKVMQELEQFRK